MADELTFTSEAVLKYLVDNGGKVSNHELVKHFKKFLTGPESQPDARAVFKEYVNAVATIKQEDGVKYVVLKKRSRIEKNGVESFTPESLSKVPEDSMTEAKKFKLSNESVNSSQSQGVSHVGILHSHSSPSILSMGPTQTTPPVLWSSDLPPGHVPQPPPRRKHSMRGKENRGAKYEESIRQLNEGREINSSPRKEEIQEVVSPGNVKEKAHFLNKMASESDPSQKQPTVPGRRRDHRDDKAGDDDDTASVSTLDPRRKEWIVKAARCDYHELVRLLREEPKLAYVKDHNKFTALHWAAKHGNLDVIKLLAGTYKVDPNARTGYSAMHLAAMFGREEIMEVLINTYQADPSLRDYSGKRPLSYLAKNQAERFLTLFPSLTYPVVLCGKAVTGRKDKDPGLVRMGSLNSKTKKTSVLYSGGRAITRMKSWGSADNIQDRAINLMPPPKTYPKKKKSRKHADIIGISENWRGRSGDSDSDSASGVIS
ncbi:ankyrin repeat domain-containing protein SOWAHC-like isoform X2 [Stegodyphus dumicola]|uniref:ankyrin repeat domain-containing protein SOWAHC-like isoform X2 n=1 Tax=Stegodyphus dumicola TaxID=202533 RepID=UPI0015ADE0F4|nr:ankyrin repeat domain-containing protein SOWAHC-like isoform X2 [Stegodyphus dumicola]